MKALKDREETENDTSVPRESRQIERTQERHPGTPVKSGAKMATDEVVVVVLMWAFGVIWGFSFRVVLVVSACRISEGKTATTSGQNHVDKNVFQERISERMRDQINPEHLQCYFKLWGLGCMLSCTDRVLVALRRARLKMGGLPLFEGVRHFFKPQTV